MFEHLAVYRVVLVSGPHRSGTTICARMIANDTGLTFYPEEAFEPDNLPGWLDLIDAVQGGAIQCPSMCAYLDGPGQQDDIATVVVHRDLDDILSSQEKVGWKVDGFYSERYRAELELYEATGDQLLAAVKYEYWASVQRDMVAHPYDVDYESLSDHPLWLPKRLRQELEPRQTAL